jgi:hypothetical protein
MAALYRQVCRYEMGAPDTEINMTCRQKLILCYTCHIDFSDWNAHNFIPTHLSFLNIDYLKSFQLLF